MMTQVLFHYSKTINVTLTFFTDFYLNIGGRSYFKYQLLRLIQSVSVDVQSRGYVLSLLSKIVHRKLIPTLTFMTRSKTTYH